MLRQKIVGTRLKKRRNNLTSPRHRYYRLYYNICNTENSIVRRKIFISKPFETQPAIYGQGRNIFSRRQIYLFPVRAERELANFGHADRDCVHFFKRCYRINGSTLHPSADISDLPSDIRVEISDSPCTGHKTRCASYKNIRKKWRDRRQARAILFPTIRGLRNIIRD